MIFFISIMLSSANSDHLSNATLSLKNSVDVKTLSSTLGHYSAGFTLSTYTHATPEMMGEAADTMGDVIGKAI